MSKYKRTQVDIDLHNQGKRICLECWQILILFDFNKSPRGWKGLQAYCKKCFDKLYRLNDLAGRASYTRDYRKGNRNYLKDHRIQQQNRRTRIDYNDIITNQYMEFLYKLDVCFYCENIIDEIYRTIDHIIPISRSGIHKKTNLVMACNNCNSRKRSMLVQRFIERFSTRKQIEIMEKINVIQLQDIA